MIIPLAALGVYPDQDILCKEHSIKHIVSERKVARGLLNKVPRKIEKIKKFNCHVKDHSTQSSYDVKRQFNGYQTRIMIKGSDQRLLDPCEDCWEGPDARWRPFKGSKWEDRSTSTSSHVSRCRTTKAPRLRQRGQVQQYLLDKKKNKWSSFLYRLRYVVSMTKMTFQQDSNDLVFKGNVKNDFVSSILLILTKVSAFPCMHLCGIINRI